MNKILLLIFILGAGSLCAQNEKPNVIIVYADDLGYGDLSCYNKNSKINTPNIDALTEKGIQFTDAHSTSSVCSPSRYGLLMGRYQWRGKLKKGIVGEWGDPVIEDELQTMPELFKKNGYQTAMVGKWHLGMTWPFKEGKGQTTHQKWKSRIKGPILPTDFDWEKGISNGPLQHGFDSYFGDGTINFPPYAFIQNNHFEKAPSEMLKNKGLPDEGKWECRKGPATKNWDIRAVPQRNQSELIKLLKQQKKNQPFFVYYALSGPHAPIIPKNKNRSQAGAYGAYVEEIDDWVGEIIQTLKAKELYQNTIIVFSSDNGPEHYAYPRMNNFNHFSNASLNGLKRDLTEGGHRVPLIFSYPKKINENLQYPHLTSQMDLYRTFASLLNAKPSKKNGEDSISFADIINKNSTMQGHRKQLIHHTVNGSFALRKGDWLFLQPKKKYITRGHTKSLPFVSEKGWLFNLKEDLGQMENKIDRELNIAEDMRKALISLSK